MVINYVYFFFIKFLTDWGRHGVLTHACLAIGDQSRSPSTGQHKSARLRYSTSALFKFGLWRIAARLRRFTSASACTLRLNQ